MTNITGREPRISQGVKKDDRPAMGQWVTAVATVKKDWKGNRTIGGDEPQWGWQRTEKEITGMYIGWRNVYDGTWREALHWDGDGGYEPAGYNVYDREKQHEVWLIVPGPRRNPVRAFKEDVIW